MTVRLMTIYGTRPEAIKMAPLIGAASRHPAFEPVVVVTGQHREMLDQVNSLFGITPEHDLDLMRPGASITDVAHRALRDLGRLIVDESPDVVVVQGDTTTAFVASLAAFYSQVPVVHLEAGLRTGDLASPFPEEANRQLTARVTSLHLAPTACARENLLREGVSPADVAVTGNTVIDALIEAVERPVRFADPGIESFVRSSRRMVLVTAHRRESWGVPMQQAMSAIGLVAREHPEVGWLVPMHRNPVVRDVVRPALGRLDNVLLCEPLGYHEFAHAMAASHLVVTDSGGVQEEAPSLGKPVLVMRDTTERPEAVEAGTVELVGTSPMRIHRRLTRLLEDADAHAAMANAVNPYGDGRAARRCVAAIEELFGLGTRESDFDYEAGEPSIV